MPVRGRLIARLSFGVWLGASGCHETVRPGQTSEVPAPCSNAPQMVARMDALSTGFVLDEGSAYLSMNGIWRVPKTGGALELLTTPGPTGPLVRSGDQLFWTEAVFRDTTARVLSTWTYGDPRAGAVVLLGAGLSSPPTTAGIPQARVAGLAVTAGHVSVLLGGPTAQLFWLERTSGGMVGTLGAGGPGWYTLIGDDQGVFLGSSTSISPVTPTGATLVRPATPRGFALDGTHLYWREMPTVGVGSQLMRAPRGDLNAAQDLGPISDEDSFALAVDEQFVYWSDRLGKVERRPKGGGPATLVGSAGAFDDDDYDAAVAVDERYVYWYAGAPGARASDDEPLWLMRTCKARAP